MLKHGIQNLLKHFILTWLKSGRCNSKLNYIAFAKAVPRRLYSAKISGHSKSSEKIFNLVAQEQFAHLPKNLLNLNHTRIIILLVSSNP